MTELKDLLNEVKVLAKKYRLLTGRPLGVTGEIAEAAAATLLNLTLAEVRTPGYDAADANGKKYQIKGRCILADSKPSQRVGSIKLAYDWDAVLLVLIDEDFEVLEILEADRREVEIALVAPGSIARNERGALGVSKFRSIGKTVWSRKESSVHLIKN